jgi:hypothetical protein
MIQRASSKHVFIVFWTNCVKRSSRYRHIVGHHQFFCPSYNIVKQNLCNPTPEFPDILWHSIKIYDTKVFLLTKIKPEYSDILYNLTHLPGPLVCRIRQVACCKNSISPIILPYVNYKHTCTGNLQVQYIVKLKENLIVIIIMSKYLLWTIFHIPFTPSVIP